VDFKEIQLVNKTYRLVVERLFHERDILALLILLRPHAKANSPIRELSDFIAHREKDRGALKKYIQHVVEYVDVLKSSNKHERNTHLRIDVVYTREAFHKSINEVLSNFNLASLDQTLADDVFICVMSLLQNVRLFNKNEELGVLTLVCINNELHLSAIIKSGPPENAKIVFPALSVPNRYWVPSWNGDRKIVVPLVEAQCKKGVLRLLVEGKDPA
jgi:hypothetical protein